MFSEDSPYFKTVDFTLFVNDRFHLLDHFYDSGKKTFDWEKNLHVLYLNPSLTAPLGSGVLAVLEAEGQFTYDFDRHDFDDDVDLRNAYIQTLLPGVKWMSVSVGQQALRTMDGLIYDDESPTFRMKADLERGFSWPLKLDALITEVKHTNPYVHADLKYCFSLLESISLSYGWFRDTDDGVARIFNSLEEERVYTSRSRMQWYGFSAQKFIGNALVKTTFIYERGGVHLRTKSMGSHSMDMRGYLADVTCEYSLTDRLSTTLFLLFASGDKNPTGGAFRSFVAIDPYVDKTNIFFNGGIDSQFSSDNVGLNGVQTSGVMTPGLSLDYRMHENIYFKSVFAYLFTHHGIRGEGRVYGWEADFTSYYNLKKNIQLFTEINIFDPGNYFKRITSYNDHVATEILIGINYFFNN